MTRRCAWCAVRLRWWQFFYCRTCRWAADSAGLYLQGGGPPCRQGSRRNDDPDTFRRR